MKTEYTDKALKQLESLAPARANMVRDALRRTKLAKFSRSAGADRYLRHTAATQWVLVRYAEDVLGSGITVLDITESPIPFADQCVCHEED